MEIGSLNLIFSKYITLYSFLNLCLFFLLRVFFFLKLPFEEWFLLLEKQKDWKSLQLAFHCCCGSKEFCEFATRFVYSPLNGANQLIF